ncbi:MAG: helix-turn-helix transcriptional regulator [Solirubrobacteraceae bacterium]
MDAPQVKSPEDVLAQPTRARLFTMLSELRRPAGTAELADRLRLHPNGVRIHLERMERAGLLARAHVRARRGRPSDAWAIAPGAEPGGRAPSGYRDLGRWLARALRAQPAGRPESIEATGREVGRELAPGGVGHDLDAFISSLVALGFQPEVEQRDAGTLRLCLHNCPYAEAVRENQPAVCALHRGMTRGLMDELQPTAELSAFVPHDPDVGRCVVELRLASATSA